MGRPPAGPLRERRPRADRGRGARRKPRRGRSRSRCSRDVDARARLRRSSRAPRQCGAPKASARGSEGHPRGADPTPPLSASPRGRRASGTTTTNRARGSEDRPSFASTSRARETSSLMSISPCDRTRAHIARVPLREAPLRLAYPDREEAAPSRRRRRRLAFKHPARLPGGPTHALKRSGCLPGAHGWCLQPCP